MMKKSVWLLIVLTCVAVAASAWAQTPSWHYPVKPLTLEDRSDFLALTTLESLISADYAPYHLVDLRLRKTGGDMQLRKEAAEALTRMFEAATEAGFTLYVKSAYRSYQTQKTMYENRLERYGRDDGVVAYPGSSEHQTGLAVDVLNYEWTQQDGMRPEFAKTPEARWMFDNCARFGFILRYMEDKQDITGIIYEPWHFRYVGDEVAAYIMDNHMSLEEFTTEYQQAIAAYEAAGGDFVLLCKRERELPPPLLLNEANAEGDSEVSLFYQEP
ncbi:MAG: M15 family metallopeptidase [Eubacteriales bacterium]|nr:M15 family metallopeptidase [Eubacteriales bacterium]MDD4711113.1 M15 family metallopeptidase [Eubacteriales bacterium]